MMRFILAILISIFTANFVFAADDSQILKFKAKIGFVKSDDTIVDHNFFDDGKRLLIIGQKILQIWDVENAKLLNSVPHQIQQFAPKGFVNYILLGIPQILSWKPYLIDPNGKWLITIEKIGDRKIKSAIVRDLQTAKQIAVIELPEVSIDYATFDEQKGEIMTYGETDDKTAFANWNKDDFSLKQVIAINSYKWHQLIRNERKMLVGAGDVKVFQKGTDIKQGATLTLRDVKTGAIEKEYTAKNLLEGTTFYKTSVSRDEKILVSEHDKRIFVWEIDGDGQPKFEISAQNPKEDYNLIAVIGEKSVVVSVDKKLRVYDFDGNGTPRFELVSDKPNDSVNLVGATKDGRFMIVRDDIKVSVLDITSDGKPLYEVVRDSEKERLTTVKILDNENYLAIGRVNRSEKKPVRTEFYNIESGKKSFDVPFEIGNDVRFTPANKFLFTQVLGAAYVWNFAENRFNVIPLEVYSPENNPNKIYLEPDTPRNTEDTALSPNGKFILRYGEKVVSVFDTATGKEIQMIFDAEKVKYDKENKIKKSGLNNAGWSNDGKYVYAFDQTNFFGKYKTISFWQVSK